jgi:hypothetical protein
MWMNFLESDLNSRFEKAMFDLLRNFNFIDLNLGLCISFLASRNDPQSTYKKLASISFDQRMKWFEKSLHSEQTSLSEKAIGEFNKWLIDADQARKLRNIYVHAIWRFFPDVLGKPVRISSPVWMKEKLGDDLYQQLSIDELEAKVSMVSNVFKNHMKLRKKYSI